MELDGLKLMATRRRDDDLGVAAEVGDVEGLAEGDKTDRVMSMTWAPPPTGVPVTVALLAY